MLDAPKPRKLSLALAEDAMTRSKRILQGLNEQDAPGYFGVTQFDRLLKTTVTLCPTCLAHVPGLVFERGGRVFLERKCPVHKGCLAVLENDARYYFLSSKDSCGKRFAEDRVENVPPYVGVPGLEDEACCGPGESCADQWGNKTCTVLVEVTDACNLACKVCYSDSKGDRFLPFEDFKRHIGALADKKGGLDSVQVTGGEASLHPQFFEMIAYLHQRGDIRRIYLPTNGLILSREGFAERLVPFRDRLLVLLQYDGESSETNQALRAADPQKQRTRMIERCGELGLAMQLTMTLVKGVNVGDVRAVVQTALRYDHIKVVAMQPATSSGRYDRELDPMDRLTLSDLVKATVTQGPLSMREEEFRPIPCSHPNCGWITLFVRRFGMVQNLLRYVDLEKVMNQVSYRTQLSTEQLQRVVGSGGSVIQRFAAWAGKKLIRSTDVFTVAIKPFMDRYNYDQDRVLTCCHHLLNTRGQPVSFCEYNALLRPKDSWAKFPVKADLPAIDGVAGGPGEGAA